MNKKVREYLEWQLINANDSLGKEIITNIIQDLEVLEELKSIIKSSEIKTTRVIDNNQVIDTQIVIPLIYIEGKIKEWLEEK